MFDHQLPGIEEPQDPVSYKDFSITAAPRRLLGSLDWSLNLYIGKREAGAWDYVRFSGDRTYDDLSEAVRQCEAYGQRIIDREEPGLSLERAFAPA